MNEARGLPLEFLVGRLAGAFVVLVVFQSSPARGSAGEDDLTRDRRIIDGEQRRLDEGGYGHAFVSSALGRGLRTNNPYRLEHVLGDSPKGWSVSALYFDLGAGYLLGDPNGLEHGPSANLSVALTGIRQEVLTPGYRALMRFDSRWSSSLRLGVPIVLEPDLGGGVELGLAGVFHVLGGVAAYSELVYSLFFGAATYEVDTTVIPIISLQLGLWVDYEVLP